MLYFVGILGGAFNSLAANVPLVSYVACILRLNDSFQGIANLGCLVVDLYGSNSACVDTGCRGLIFPAGLNKGILLISTYCVVMVPGLCVAVVETEYLYALGII